MILLAKNVSKTLNNKVESNIVSCKNFSLSQLTFSLSSSITKEDTSSRVWRSKVIN